MNKCSWKVGTCMPSDYGKFKLDVLWYEEGCQIFLVLLGMKEIIVILMRLHLGF
jgi:hypothetical protein